MPSRSQNNWRAAGFIAPIGLWRRCRVRNREETSGSATVSFTRTPTGSGIGAVSCDFVNKQNPQISFIIPVFNRVDLTRAFAANLTATVDEPSWEAIFVDDASTDETRQFLASLEPPFRSIRTRKNRGFARAVNLGAVEAKAAILGLLNNDLVLSEGWLPPMLKLLNEAPDAGAVGNVQRNPATGLVDHAGVFFNPWGMPTHAHKNRKGPPGKRWRERNAATAACMLIRKEDFVHLGGFYENYRNGMEDIDLCVRLKQEGKRIYVSHEVQIEHLVSSSPGRHDANNANTELFRKRCAAIAAPWGLREWPVEYFRRYGRFWWRMNPQLAWLALRMLLRIPVRLPEKPID